MIERIVRKYVPQCYRERMSIRDFYSAASSNYARYMRMADDETARHASFQASGKDSNYVYFITDGELTKIGISSGKISRRIEQLQCGNGRLLIPIAVEFCNFHGEREHELHRIFKDKRKSGEWFELSMDDVLFVDDKHGNKNQYEFDPIALNIDFMRIVDNSNLVDVYDKVCSFTGSRDRYGWVREGEIDFDDLDNMLDPNRCFFGDDLVLGFVIDAEERGYDIRVQTGTRRRACDIDALREYLKSGIA